jgi:hypothetical protein
MWVRRHTALSRNCRNPSANCQLDTSDGWTGPWAPCQCSCFVRRHLPPDLNPIEQVFAKLKGFVRKAAPRMVDAVSDALAQALKTISPEDCSEARHPQSTARPLRKGRATTPAAFFEASSDSKSVGKIAKLVACLRWRPDLPQRSITCPDIGRFKSPTSNRLEAQ